MNKEANGDTLEDQIARWRAYLRRRRTIQTPSLEELEGRLRDQMAALQDTGLTGGEAFLIAVKRMGSIDAATREFGRAHAGQLWEQPAAGDDTGRSLPLLKRALALLVPDSSDDGPGGSDPRTEAVVVLGLATVAALSIKAPELFGIRLWGSGDDMMFYSRNVSLFVLPLLAGYFVWKRGFDVVRSLLLAAPFAAAAVFANVFPFETAGSTEMLTVIHVPILLWLAVGAAYLGDRWRSAGARMDFVRFSGELFIYYVLIALGGGVFTVLTWGMFALVDLDATALATEWLLPCGALGAVIVGAWLVETRQSLAGNIAPMLTRVFTPPFAVMLLVFLGVMVWTGRWTDLERDVLIVFDLLLVLVLGLLLFSVSARDPKAPGGAFDVMQLLLVVVAIAVDVFALAAIAGRIFEFGFSANKTAALGENVILLVNLAWSVWLYARFLLGRGSFSSLERWQTGYLPVHAVWAGFVIAAFPPLFGYL